MKYQGIDFSMEEFRQAVESLKGTLFPVYNEDGKITDFTSNPPFERVVAEIQYRRNIKAGTK